MKKLLSIVMSIFLLVGACFSLTACGKEELNYGKELVKLDSQLDTLIQLESGSIDMAIIDSVMAGYYATTGEFKDDIAILEMQLAVEKYGIAGRKEDKAFVSKINEALIALSDADYLTVAAEYGLTSSLCLTPATENPLEDANDNSWKAIKTAGKIVIGYTVFAPIAYEVKNGAPTKGFDIDLAKAVVEYLNQTYSVDLDVEFQEIDWDSKEALLNNGAIDLIWNGLTITEERAQNMCISVPYLNNAQVAVITKAQYEDLYEDATTSTNKLLTLFANATIGVEGGSAGEGVVVKAAE